MKLISTLILSILTFGNLTYSQEKFFVGSNSVLNKNKIDIYNESGKKINKDPVDWVYQVRPNFFCVKIENKRFIYDSNWNRLPIPGFSYVKAHYRKTDTIFAVKKDNLWGFYDLKGNLIIDHLYSKASNFENGEALVKFKEDVYFINTEGQVMDREVTKEDMRSMIDLETALSFYRDNSSTSKFGSIFPEGTELLVKNNKQGLIRIEDKKVLLKAKYNKILDFVVNNKYAVVNLNGKYGIIGIGDIEIVPPVYQEVWVLGR